MKNYFRLFRISGLFSLWSNILAISVIVWYEDNSIAITGIARQIFRNKEMAIHVIIVSVLLYLIGMIWNDISDVYRDEKINPNKPLVQKKVSLPSAFTIGLLLIPLAFIASYPIGHRAFCSVGILISLIMLYNTVAKKTPFIGAIVMGMIRFGHAIFGLLVLGEDFFDRTLLGAIPFISCFSDASLFPTYPLLLFLYITGLTFLSELESRRGRRIELLIALLLLTSPIIISVISFFSSHWIFSYLQNGSLLLVLFSYLIFALLIFAFYKTLFHHIIKALKEGDGKNIRKMTFKGLTCIFLLDAIAMFGVNPFFSIAVLLFIPAFLVVSSFFRMD